MYSPRLLTNLAVSIAFAGTILFVWLLFALPYTGFDMAFDEAENHFVVTRVDDWVAEQGLQVGAKVKTIASSGQPALTLDKGHYPKNTFEARRANEHKPAQLLAMAAVYDVLKDGAVTIGLSTGKNLQLSLHETRPVNSIPFEVWVCIFLTIMCFLLPALTWAWKPGSRETIYLLLSGTGLALATISAALLYTMEMSYLPLWGYWLVFELVGFGNFIFIAFAATLLLYFPTKLKHADLINSGLLWSLVVATAYFLLSKWDFSQAVGDQFLFFNYGEVYFVEAIFFFLIIALCITQIRINRHKPVERAQSLWITLAWTLCPSVFMVFYLLPILLGQDAVLSRTWTTAALLLAFAMVLVGVSRFRFFNLERHIGSAYQWSFVSLFFFALDVVFLSFANLSPATSTFILLALVLWVYLPIRQWFFSKMSRDNQRRYQALFGSAVSVMIENSLIPTLSGVRKPENAWRNVLETVFEPVSLLAAPDEEITRVSKRGQGLIIGPNRFSGPLVLEYADRGNRIFVQDDVNLVETISLLFVRLYDFRDGYVAGQIRERDRIRRDLHDQIGHRLLSLVYSAKDTKSIQLAQDTIEQLKELIQALKDKPVALQKLVIELRQLCEDTCAQVNISLHWHDESTDNDQQVTSNQYLNVLNITRELLSNTIKHSRASNVTISVGEADGCLVLTVNDNGIGFSRDKIHPGSGLYNIHSRVDEMSANIDWQTSSGTKVVIRIPIGMIEETVNA
ncbi:MAG: ATP-binding protein [Pseudomonadales bacterium]